MFSNKLYLENIKGLIEIFILVILFYLLYVIVDSSTKLNSLVNDFIYVSLFFAVIIAVYNSMILLRIYKYFGFYPVNNYSYYIPWYYLNLDFNFSLLPIFFGFTFILLLFTKKMTRILNVGLTALLLLFSTHILLSNSRRGFILLVIILSILLIFYIVSYLSLKETYRTFRSNIVLFYYSLVVVSLLFFSFIFYSSYSFKVKSLQFIGIKDVTSSKRIISSIIYNHFSRFKRKLSYEDLNKILWSISFDSKDPDNGWGYGNYKTISPLIGVNVEIVPQGSIGYFLDSTCTYAHSSTHIYSNTLIGNSEINENDIVIASVFCYVSADFNGNIVCIRADGETFGNRVYEYDYKKKGTWQKLSISPVCRKGNSPVSLYFNKQGDTTISKLDGYIIFAYPEYKLTRSIVSIPLNKNNERFSSTNSMNYIEFHSTIDLFYDFKEVNSNNECNSDSFQYCNEKWKAPLQIKRIEPLKSRNKNIYSLASLFNFRDIKLKIFLQPIDKDILRNLTRKILIEDTIYHAPKFNLSLNTSSNKFFNDRFSRWQFALLIYSKEYNWKQKIFGGSFDFLNWYGYYFLKDKTKTDYPHNPFLYILLYSGIIGLVLYVILLYRVCFYYIKYRKEYGIFFIFFLITFFFTFFSSGNPFDPPLMGFLMILPFFIHSVHKKDKLEVGSRK